MPASKLPRLLSKKNIYKRALEEAKEDVLLKARIAVANQKTAEHLSKAAGITITVSDELWDKNWEDLVTAVEYLQERLTNR